jgi:uncharacterized protein with HEPN domain
VKRPRERVLDMLDAIGQIERYAVRGRDALASDELVRVWVVHHLQILCEAATALGREFHNAHPDIPWAEMVAMRNVLVHDYGGVDVNEVWRTVERDLPPLKQQLAALASALNDRQSG